MALSSDLTPKNLPANEICVVLSGRSFLGKQLVSRLLQSGGWNVRIADAHHSLRLDREDLNSALPDALSSGAASYVTVDVRDRSQLLTAFEGASVVFYIDVVRSSMTDFISLHKTIVQGTKNVISACLQSKVKRLIYNSTSDVVFNGQLDIVNGDESLPYPSRFRDRFSELKAQAECLVLRANALNRLLTCVLRPSNVFGPGDSYLPLILKEAQAGRSKYIIGDGQNFCDFTYVENVAYAHLCAERALRTKTALVGGKVFFITNDEPMRLWEFISLMLEGLGYHRPTVHLPVKAVVVNAILAEYSDKISARYKRSSSHLSLSTVNELICTRTFNCFAAKQILNYLPIISLEEALKVTVDKCTQAAPDVQYSIPQDSSELSRSYKILGGGKIAELILWRDEKRTFMLILASFLIYYWVFFGGGSFLSATASLLQLSCICLFILGHLPSSIYGVEAGHISPAYFEVSEELVQEFLTSLVCMWNKGIQLIRQVAKGTDWIVLIKALCTLLCLKLLLLVPLTALAGAGLVYLFTAFYVYEQMEEEIDGLVQSVVTFIIGKLPVDMKEQINIYQFTGKKKT